MKLYSYRNNIENYSKSRRRKYRMIYPNSNVKAGTMLFYTYAVVCSSLLFRKVANISKI